jgi:DedD protein
MAASKKGARGEMVLESRHLFGLFVLLAVLFGVVFTLGYLLGKGQGDSQAHVAAIRADDSVDTQNPAPADDPTATPPAASDSDKPAATPSASTGTDWSFYHSSDPKPANATLQPAPSSKPAPKPTQPAASPSVPAANPASNSASPNAPATKPSAKPAPAPAAAKPASAPAPSKTSKVAVGSPLIPKGAIVLQVAALEKESDALEMAQVLQQRKFPVFILPAGPDKYYHVQVGPYATLQAANAAQHDLESQGFKSIVKR